MRIGTLLLIVCVGVCAVAWGGDMFRWTDGRLAPPAAARETDTIEAAHRVATTGEPRPTVTLRFELRADAIEAWADNTLAGPVEVELRHQRGHLASANPPLPARIVVPALQRRVVSHLGRETTAELWLDAVPGDPGAQPRDIEYLYPLRTTQLQIEQGWGGAFSHSDLQNRYAVDFAADIGTPVIAARAGTVMEIEADFERAGLNTESDASRANFVRIVHDDGTMALYAHLKSDGVLVRVGQRVRKAETIGLSGNTGFTTGPHLHFAVQVNSGMALQSIPFRMFGPQGILRFSEAKQDAP